MKWLGALFTLGRWNSLPSLLFRSLTREYIMDSIFNWARLASAGATYKLLADMALAPIELQKFWSIYWEDGGRHDVGRKSAQSCYGWGKKIPCFLLNAEILFFKNLPLSGTFSVDGKLMGDGMVFKILQLIEEALNFSHVLVASSNPLDSVEHGVKFEVFINYLIASLNIDFSGRWFCASISAYSNALGWWSRLLYSPGVRKVGSVDAKTRGVPDRHWPPCTLHFRGLNYAMQIFTINFYRKRCGWWAWQLWSSWDP